MLFAFFLMTAISDWAPVRWISSDPKSLDLLQGTPFNCILVEGAPASAKLAAEARKRGIAVLGIYESAAKEDIAVSAKAAEFDGVVLEGDFEDARVRTIRQALEKTRQVAVELPSRSRMRFDSQPVVGTNQGVWPGIQAEEAGSTRAAPSGAPWISTNGGFLRFLRAVAPETPVWIANRPPGGNIVTAERYIQAIADAAIIGARWVIALDAEFSRKLLASDGGALRDWKRIADHAAWFESHADWRHMSPLSQLALVQDAESGALFSGGVLDMIAVKHTPVKAVPARSLSPESMTGVRMAVNVSPASLTDQQKEAMRAFARSGGTTLSGPATWKFPAVDANRITLSDEDVKLLDEIWKEVNSMTGRRNLGARLFNVSSMLSNLLEPADGKRAVLHLVNYSGYPVENVTVHLLGKYKSARLIAPGTTNQKVDLYDIEEGTGVDVSAVNTVAALMLER